MCDFWELPTNWWHDLRPPSPTKVQKGFTGNRDPSCSKRDDENILSHNNRYYKNQKTLALILRGLNDRLGPKTNIPNCTQVVHISLFSLLIVYPLSINPNTQHGISQIFFSTRPKSTQTVIRRHRDLNPGPAEDVPSNSPLHQYPLLCLAQYTSQSI